MHLFNAVTITSATMFLAFSLTLIVIVGTKETRTILLSNWKILFLLFLLNLLLKLPINSPFFHGMEYEDCYVHQATARHLTSFSSTQETGISPFREYIFSLGSITNGGSSQHFYNYIGYPSAIYLMQQVIGDKPFAGHLVSLLASCTCVIFIYLLSTLLKISPQLPISSSLIYTFLPIGIIFSASTSADILSGLCILTLILLLYVKEYRTDSPFANILLCAAISTVLIYSILVKRENVLLLCLLPIIAMMTRHKINFGLWQKMPSSQKVFWNANCTSGLFAYCA